MTITEISEKDKQVLDYVKSELDRYANQNTVLIFFGVSAKDMVKFIERPEACGKWPFEFVCQMTKAIDKTHKKYIIPYPEIEDQTEEDRVIAKILMKNNLFKFGTNTFFKNGITVQHVIQYLERDSSIYNWNAIFAVQVQQEVIRVKEFIL